MATEDPGDPDPLAVGQPSVAESSSEDQQPFSSSTLPRLPEAIVIAPKPEFEDNDPDFPATVYQQSSSQESNFTQASPLETRGLYNSLVPRPIVQLVRVENANRTQFYLPNVTSLGTRAVRPMETIRLAGPRPVGRLIKINKVSLPSVTSSGSIGVRHVTSVLNANQLGELRVYNYSNVRHVMTRTPSSVYLSNNVPPPLMVLKNLPGLPSAGKNIVRLSVSRPPNQSATSSEYCVVSQQCINLASNTNTVLIPSSSRPTATAGYSQAVTSLVTAPLASNTPSSSRPTATAGYSQAVTSLVTAPLASNTPSSSRPTATAGYSQAVTSLVTAPLASNTQRAAVQMRKCVDEEESVIQIVEEREEEDEEGEEKEEEMQGGEEEEVLTSSQILQRIPTGINNSRIFVLKKAQQRKIEKPQDTHAASRPYLGKAFQTKNKQCSSTDSVPHIVIEDENETTTSSNSSTNSGKRIIDTDPEEVVSKKRRRLSSPITTAETNKDSLAEINKSIEDYLRKLLCSDTTSVDTDQDASALPIGAKSRVFVRAPAPPTTINCGICRRMFTVESEVEFHRKLHFGNMFRCIHCYKLFQHESSLMRHIRLLHEEKNLAFKCTDCDATFAMKQYLLNHMRVHSGERPYTCDVCGAGFKAIGNLHNHKTTHSEERKFSCDICDKSFKRVDKLRRHVLTHANLGRKWCWKCKKYFKGFETLRQHKISDHGFHHCQKCNRFYQTAELFAQHKCVPGKRATHVTNLRTSREGPSHGDRRVHNPKSRGRKKGCSANTNDVDNWDGFGTENASGVFENENLKSTTFRRSNRTRRKPDRTNVVSDLDEALSDSESEKSEKETPPRKRRWQKQSEDSDFVPSDDTQYDIDEEEEEEGEEEGEGVSAKEEGEEEETEEGEEGGLDEEVVWAVDVGKEVKEEGGEGKEGGQKGKVDLEGKGVNGNKGGKEGEKGTAKRQDNRKVWVEWEEAQNDIILSLEVDKNEESGLGKEGGKETENEGDKRGAKEGTKLFQHEVEEWKESQARIESLIAGRVDVVWDVVSENEEKKGLESEAVERGKKEKQGEEKEEEEGCEVILVDGDDGEEEGKDNEGQNDVVEGVGVEREESVLGDVKEMDVEKVSTVEKGDKRRNEGKGKEVEEAEVVLLSDEEMEVQERPKIILGDGWVVEGEGKQKKVGSVTVEIEGEEGKEEKEGKREQDKRLTMNDVIKRGGKRTKKEVLEGEDTDSAEEGEWKAEAGDGENTDTAEEGDEENVGKERRRLRRGNTAMCKPEVAKNEVGKDDWVAIGKVHDLWREMEAVMRSKQGGSLGMETNISEEDELGPRDGRRKWVGVNRRTGGETEQGVSTPDKVKQDQKRPRKLFKLDKQGQKYHIQSERTGDNTVESVNTPETFQKNEIRHGRRKWVTANRRTGNDTNEDGNTPDTFVQSDNLKDTEFNESGNSQDKLYNATIQSENVIKTESSDIKTETDEGLSTSDKINEIIKLDLGDQGMALLLIK